MNRIYGLIGLLVIGALLFCLGWLSGVDHEQDNATQIDLDQMRKAFEQGQELGTVRDRVVTEYVDRVRYVETRGATIIKEVPVYVSAKADAACTVNAGFVRLHDAAATGAELAAPGRSSAADEAPSGIALSAVAATTVANYTACSANAEQLSKLQEYVRSYQAKQEGKAPP